MVEHKTEHKQKHIHAINKTTLSIAPATFNIPHFMHLIKTSQYTHWVIGLRGCSAARTSSKWIAMQHAVYECMFIMYLSLKGTLAHHVIPRLYLIRIILRNPQSKWNTSQSENERERDQSGKINCKMFRYNKSKKNIKIEEKQRMR